MQVPQKDTRGKTPSQAHNNATNNNITHR